MNTKQTKQPVSDRKKKKRRKAKAQVQAKSDKNVATDTARPSTVGDYMTRAVVTVPPRMGLEEVCQQMVHHRISSCIVADAENRPLGLISERAIVRRIANDKSMKVTAGKAMSSPLLTCSPRTQLPAALSMMRSNHIRRLGVVRNKKLRGIITQADLLEATNRQFVKLTREHSKLRETAMRDELTGLYNRRALTEFFKEELSRVKRYGGLLALAFFDLDHFKDVNDLHGHDVGDKVLQRFSRVLRSCCRKVDIAARPGGEEFAVLLPAAGTRAARVFAERVRRETEKIAVRVGKKTVGITTSAGVCKWTAQASSMPAMLKQADIALFRAKGSGRNRVCVAR
jgi:diguanylate cyclase (GGDEF)-like protein